MRESTVTRTRAEPDSWIERLDSSDERRLAGVLLRKLRQLGRWKPHFAATASIFVTSAAEYFRFHAMAQRARHAEHVAQLRELERLANHDARAWASRFLFITAAQVESPRADADGLDLELAAIFDVRTTPKQATRGRPRARVHLEQGEQSDA